ncbi:hypothetical protein MSAN_01741000 [Mycena sanguinolenta]|uniref:Uncharacterized protein n=1 Tax=Mycena sanguinolenta TaxID=230812 RepID=A0A8H6Y007_9AGAR|nr:hypothetical protein MSAN_01741000 [Mycena sanguinolenta]
MAKTKRKSRVPPAPRTTPCFAGARLEFLAARVNDFHMACNEGCTCSFWCNIFRKYWVNFPWRLPLDVEPHCGMDLSDPRGEAELNLAIEIRLATEVCIQRYFWHKRTVYCRLLVATAATSATAAAVTAGAALTAATSNVSVS